VGVLYVRKGTRIQPFLHGGDQERGRRASTHNVPAIVGLGRAAALAGEEMAAEEKRLTILRDRMIRGILETIEGTLLNGHPSRRLPNHVSLSFEGVEGEALLLNLDMAGVACSTGSACMSSSLEPSHVLRAIGLHPEIARGSLRFTLGKYTTEDEVAHVLGILPGIVKKLRSASPRRRQRNV
jgi:cysteine desulfurase